MASKTDAVLLADRWNLGQRTDFPRAKIGGNALWKSYDAIPELLGAPLRKRGGWGKKQTFGGTPTYVRQVASGPFNGGHYLFAVTSSGQVYRIAHNGSSWAIDGTTRNVGALLQNPVFYWDEMFFPSYNGTQTMSRASETTVAEYTYTATYKPTYLTAWKNRLVGAVGERLLFGPPGDPNQTWDDDAVYVRSQPIKGLAVARTATMVFYDGHIERVRGSIPAGYDVTNDDIVIDDMFVGAFGNPLGLIDAHSICHWQDMVIWADRFGIYMTDGAAPLDLTAVGGVKKEWREAVLTYSTDRRVAAGVCNDVLFVSVTDLGDHAQEASFACHLPTRTWWRNTNMPFTSFAAYARDAGEVIAACDLSTGLVATLTDIFEPTTYHSDNENAGTAVTPVIEFPFYALGGQPQRIIDLHIGYSIDDTASSTPTLDVSAALDPNPGASYVSYGNAGTQDNLPGDDLHGTASTGYRWRRVPIRAEANGIAPKVVLSGAADDLQIHAIGVTIQPHPGYRQV